MTIHPPHDIDSLDPIPLPGPRREAEPQDEPDPESLWEQVPGRPTGVQRHRTTGYMRDVRDHTPHNRAPKED